LRAERKKVHDTPHRLVAQRGRRQEDGKTEKKKVERVVLTRDRGWMGWV
jgi:hypothetical protein